jgi:integrase
MSVRDRSWFTRADRKKIDPRAKELAAAAGEPKQWSQFKYREKVGAALGIEPRRKWIVDYADQEGDRHIETFEKKKDAEKRHAEVTVAVDKGTHTAASKSVTVAEACESWIDRVKANGMRGRGPVERATSRQYKQHTEHHIVPRLGKLKLSQLNKTVAENFQKDLLEKLERPLAKKVFTSFKSMLKVAGFSHVAEGLSIGTLKRKRPIEAGRDFPSTAEIKRLIEAAQDEIEKAEHDKSEKAEKAKKRRRRALKEHALLLTAALTGLRASELRGLRWRDVDLKAGELHVRQRADRFNEIGAPKSDASVRIVPLDPGALTTALKAWSLACPKGEEGLVFPSTTGRIEHHSNMLKSLGPVIKKAKVIDKEGEPKYGMHAFRHFFASWCINPKNRDGRELPPKEVQALMGHSSIVITLDLYGHLFQRSSDRSELAASAAALLG